MADSPCPPGAHPPRRYAFVVFSDKEGASEALTKLNQTELRDFAGRKASAGCPRGLAIRVQSIAQPAVPCHVTNAVLSVAPWGSQLCITGPRNELTALTPLQLTIVRSEVNNKLFVGNFPRGLSKEQVLEAIKREVTGERGLGAGIQEAGPIEPCGWGATRRASTKMGGFQGLGARLSISLVHVPPRLHTRCC